MTNETKSSQNTTRPNSRKVTMVAYDQAHILDVVGPLEVLSGADLFLPEGVTPYATQLVAPSGKDVATTSGLTLKADASCAEALAADEPIDTLIISGGHGTTSAMQDAELMRFVAQAAAKARRVVSICTGAMILADLGLLDNRRATTHWWWCPVLSKNYPAVEVDANAIYVRDGKVWTSAGVTAGMDLALALLAEDWGQDVALQVARYNVMYMIRPGGQAQFSANLVAAKAEDPAIAASVEHIISHVADTLTVTGLAARACMSERSFARKFKEETGLTPAGFVEAARLQAARVELEQSSRPVEQIALSCGFGSGERMRRVFQRNLGISAGDYRDRFHIPELGSKQGPKSGAEQAGRANAPP